MSPVSPCVGSDGARSLGYRRRTASSLRGSERTDEGAGMGRASWQSSTIGRANLRQVEAVRSVTTIRLGTQVRWCRMLRRVRQDT
jgi:hypothetical protein